ncbi:hypothetical protein Pcinc_012717 [Petrolisthes cinctipes]|uniref:Uncharacterized protein n=1 Tax=Petrolisthes cinctipes TaxID=88211 RepID=A0AAE1G039_PETCI|nr:hypothetical protein Pcinc_012717 [Petrolisthes cinctipes]
MRIRNYPVDTKFLDDLDSLAAILDVGSTVLFLDIHGPIYYSLQPMQEGCHLFTSYLPCSVGTEYVTPGWKRKLLQYSVVEHG